MNISILKFDDLKKEELEEQEQIFNLSDQDIYISFKPRKLLNMTGGNTVQFVTYDSPLVPVVDESNKGENIVRDFISLSLFDENGNELNITDLPEDSRPFILYKQTNERSMKNCFFYNESREDLDTNGIHSKNVTIEGIKYLNCSLEHLTSFTAQYKTSSSSSTSDTSDGTSSSYYISQGMKLIIMLFIIGL